MSTHILRVKLMFDKRTYRDIEIVSNESLYDFAETIIAAFDFDFDHAFGFYDVASGKWWDAKTRYELFADMGEAEPGSKSVKRTKVASVFKDPRQKMTFLFDYGDEWLFQVELRGFGTRAKGDKYPRILASKGAAPEQYPAYEDDENFDPESVTFIKLQS